MVTSRSQPSERCLPCFHLLTYGPNIQERAFDAMSGRLASGDTSLLQEMHATTSGLKVLVTTHNIQDLETARRCLGGHGYSEYAGIGRQYAGALPSATYEGDNFILDLQVVRAAVKAFKRYTSATKPNPSTLSPTTTYLRLISQQSPADATAGEWADPRCSVYLLEQRALNMVREYAQHESDSDATAPQRVARAATEAFVAAQLETFIHDLPSQLSGKNAHAVKDLLTLVSQRTVRRSCKFLMTFQSLLSMVEAALVDLLSFNIFPRNVRPLGQDPTRELRKTIQNLELKLLPQAIGLSDAFGFTDWELDR